MLYVIRCSIHSCFHFLCFRCAMRDEFVVCRRCNAFPFVTLSGRGVSRGGDGGSLCVREPERESGGRGRGSAAAGKKLRLPIVCRRNTPSPPHMQSTPHTTERTPTIERNVQPRNERTGRVAMRSPGAPKRTWPFLPYLLQAKRSNAVREATHAPHYAIHILRRVCRSAICRSMGLSLRVV